MATHDSDLVTALRKRVVALEEGHVIRDEIGGGYHRGG
jgi:cell division transport system ATP-binding protein